MDRMIIKSTRHSIHSSIHQCAPPLGTTVARAAPITTTTTATTWAMSTTSAALPVCRAAAFFQPRHFGVSPPAFNSRSSRSSPAFFPSSGPRSTAAPYLVAWDVGCGMAWPLLLSRLTINQSTNQPLEEGEGGEEGTGKRAGAREK